MKLVPNIMTLCRIGLALLLLRLEPLGPAYSAVYILCGISDMLDGPVARKTGSASSLGARLDSIADLTLIAAALYTLCPLLGLPTGILLWIVLIALIRAASILTAFCKYRTYGSIHTYGNKLAGFLLFLTPLLLPHIHHTICAAIVCTAATLSAVEELVLLLLSRELQLNRKGLFVRR